MRWLLLFPSVAALSVTRTEIIILFHRILHNGGFSETSSEQENSYVCACCLRKGDVIIQANWAACCMAVSHPDCSSYSGSEPRMKYT